ncbi:ABC transporter permease, partial [uncultured Muribaculum sp.]
MKQLYYSWRAMSGPGNSNAIKIISVALGLLMTILLMSRMALNHSFDTCYDNHRQLYQLWMQYTINGNTLDRQQQCLGKLAGAIYEELPEMVVAATTTNRNMGQGLFRGDTKFSEKAIAADSLFFKTMGIEVLKGDPVTDLAQKDVVYLSESYALMIFGGDDPIG